MAVNTLFPERSRGRIQIDGKALQRDTSVLIRIGIAIVILFFGVFLGWASLAPLEGAAISSGVVTVESSRRQIQHLEGGIVSEILVEDGQFVEDGQVLVRLRGIESKANLDLLKWRWVNARVEEARLIAERNVEPTVYLPDSLDISLDQTRINEAISTQIRILHANQQALSGQDAIFDQRMMEIENEIVGLDGKVGADAQQLSLIKEEIAGVRDLVAKGLAPKPRLLALQRAEAELNGSRSGTIAAIARSRQAIGKVRLQQEELRLEADRRIASELKVTRETRLDLRERLNVARDVQARTELRTPIAGVVVNKQIFTVNGVVNPGQVLMEIVPQDDRLIVEAMVRPADIDEVSVGLPARVRFSAFSRRGTEMTKGEVISVSADRLIEQRSGQSYYLARIAFEEGALGAAGDEVIVPGMQAEVFVVTKSRTLMSYLLEPLLQNFERGLKE